MTREEIRERADNIVEVLILSTSPSFVTAHVQSKLLSLVRATLEKAARAVCHLCRDHYSVGRDSVGLWVHDPFMGATGAEVVYSACIATEIHDLVAALDREANHA